MLTHDIGPDSRGRHDELQRFNEARLEPTSGEPYSLAREVEGRSLEEEFLQHSRAQVARAASTVPTDAVGLIKWFQSLKETGPGQHDALFPWLEHESTLAQFRWFLRQEVAGEAGFEDLVALTTGSSGTSSNRVTKSSTSTRAGPWSSNVGRLSPTSPSSARS
jgi:hypothetical protein